MFCNHIDDATSSASTTSEGGTTGNCTVSSTETDGPYPLYNSRGSSIQRVDIRDGKTGLQLGISIIINNELATVTANSSTGGYDLVHTIFVAAR